MKVKDIMTRDVKVCLPSEPLTRAAQIMWEQDCGCVPVLSADGRPIGMITDRDVCMAVYTRGSRLDEVPVEQAMATTVYSCHPNDELTEPHDTMRKHRVRRLPVVDGGGRLVGLISLADIFQAAANEKTAARRGEWAASLTETMSEITRTHCELPTGAQAGPASRTSATVSVEGSAT